MADQNINLNALRLGLGPLNLRNLRTQAVRDVRLNLTPQQMAQAQQNLQQLQLAAQAPQPQPGVHRRRREP